jgi:hypothetical protein
MAVQGSVRCCIALLALPCEHQVGEHCLQMLCPSLYIRYPFTGFLLPRSGAEENRTLGKSLEGRTERQFLRSVIVTCHPLAEHNLKPDAKMESTSSNATQFRQRQWMYLGPIAATPLAHISVTLYREAKTQKQRQLILGVGIIGSTVMTLGMRLYLLSHSGYPGQDNSDVIQSRIVEAKTEEERRAITDPSMGRIMKDMMRGFG